MQEILAPLRSWYAGDELFALATVVGVHGSAPREPGAAMAVRATGEVAGSVSGGCVEAAVYEVAQEVLRTRAPRLETYGIGDDTAFGVGLTCGGTIEVFVRPVEVGRSPELAEVLAAVDGHRPVGLATVVSGAARPGLAMAVCPDGVVGSLGGPGLDAAVAADARGLLAHGRTAMRHYGSSGERRLEDVAVFVQSLAPPPRMVVFGAIDFAAAVARIGSFLGYRVTVCDARPVFATAERFPDAHEVVRAWPHHYLAGTQLDERTVICVLTHDPKFDVPVLEVALRSPAAYIGAMGSRRTHEDRLRRLRAAGVTDEQLARLRSPIGLDLGARTPEETAVSVAAELVALRWGGSGRPLSRTTGAIHPAGIRLAAGRSAG